MLVLSRKKEEQICIGPNITVTVLRVKGRSVKIGVEAPRGVQILRGELDHPLVSRKPSAVSYEPSAGGIAWEKTPTTGG